MNFIKGNIENIIWSIAISLIAVKIAMLPLASFPFDFATYVYQARQYFEYDISPLFYWNKGWLLLVIFYIQYGLYAAILDLFGITKDNLLLLQLIYKLPLFIFDILTAVYIRKLLFQLTNNKDIARFGLVIWLCNPLVFWIIQIQAQYSIIATFLVVFSISALLSKRYLLAHVTLAAAASVYYYSLIFFPFYLLYIYKDTPRFNLLLKQTTTFFGTLLILYLPFLISHKHLQFLFGSLLHHAKPDAPSAVQEVFIPYYSLFNLPFYLVNQHLPSSLNAPTYFNTISTYATLVGLLLVGFFFLFRIYQSVVKKAEYTKSNLIADLTSVLILFLLLVGKLQTHYFIWLLPLLFISALSKKSYLLFLWSCILTLLPLINTLGNQNIGTYFLNSAEWGTVNFWLNHPPEILMANGFLALSILIFIFINLNFSLHRHINISGDTFTLISIGSLFFGWFYIILLSGFFVYTELFSSPQRHVLASRNYVNNFALSTSNENYSTVSTSTEKVIYQENFDDYNSTTPKYYGIISDNSEWFFYHHDNHNPVSATIRGLHGNKAVEINFFHGKTAVQLNTHTQPTFVFKQIGIYHGSVDIYSETDRANSTLSLRLFDMTGKIIPGSDIFIAATSLHPGWNQIQGVFYINKENSPAEMMVSLQNDGPNNITRIDNIRISKYISKEKLQLNLFRNSEIETIKYAVLDNKAVADKYVTEFSITTPLYSRIDSINFNNCNFEHAATTQDGSQKTRTMIYSFPVNCINLNESTVDITLTNTMNVGQITYSSSLKHIPQAYLYTSDKKRTLLYVLATVSLVFNFLLLSRINLSK